MKGERIAQLELLLISHPEGLRRVEIARKLGLHRSTISRYVEELSSKIDLYEEDGLIKIKAREDEEKEVLSLYETLAFNMSAEALVSSQKIQNPHLASGLRKIASNMFSYAPKISENILQIADEIDLSVEKNRHMTETYNKIMEVLIDCWVSGNIARIKSMNEEIEIAPYFIGFKEESGGRNPISVTGRIRHTQDIATIPLSEIKEAVMLDETYTIPDNLRPFGRNLEKSKQSTVDMIPLTLRLKERSALNSIASLIHGDVSMKEERDGTVLCSLEAENSIDLLLGIVKSGKSIEIVYPYSFRKKFLSYLQGIISIYQINY